jgi:CHASE1-domain containing sensor protein
VHTSSKPFVSTLTDEEQARAGQSVKRKLAGQERRGVLAFWCKRPARKNPSRWLCLLPAFDPMHS